MEENKKLVAVEERIVLEVLNYLASKPYNESAVLIQGLQTSKVIEYKDKSSDVEES